MTEQFSLKHRIREAIESARTEALSEIVQTVFRGIARKDQAEALRQALPHVIRRELSGDTISGGRAQSNTDTHVKCDPAAGSTALVPVSPAPAQNLSRSRAANLRMLNVRDELYAVQAIARTHLDLAETGNRVLAQGPSTAPSDRQRPRSHHGAHPEGTGPGPLGRPRAGALAGSFPDLHRHRRSHGRPMGARAACPGHRFQAVRR